MMNTIPYHFKIQVRDSSDTLVYEHHTVNEVDSKLGSAIALGKVCKYYDGLKNTRKIKDYRIMV